MWKLAVGFVIFAGLALWMLSKGGNIDMGGEKHGDDPTHAPAAATAPAATPSPVMAASAAAKGASAP